VQCTDDWSLLPPSQSHGATSTSAPAFIGSRPDRYSFEDYFFHAFNTSPTHSIGSPTMLVNEPEISETIVLPCS
jgi:hypothetical protein